MKLQVALDLLSIADALTLLRSVAPYVDVIEAGTPLIKQEGLRAVTLLKAAYPDKLVFADMKTMDAGELEADIAFKAGADMTTVLGMAADSTIQGAITAAQRHGRTVVADMIGVADRVARARELKTLGVQMIELHTGLDEQAARHYSLDEMLLAGKAAGIEFSVAGGIDAKRLPAVKAAGAAIAVAGAAIYGAADPAAVARELHREASLSS
jgi:3-hexulose-6-phosphate synthase